MARFKTIIDSNCIQESRVDSILNAEVSWNEFVNLSLSNSTGSKHRYTRINPDIGDHPPALDKVKHMRYLQAATQKALETGLGVEVRAVALRLVASSFYFRSTSKPISEPGSGELYRCKGGTD